MDAKARVVEAQTRIINELAECELHIGALYEKYAARFPEMKSWWLSLAAAEKVHSDLLKSMHRLLNKGCIFYNLGKFGGESLRSMEKVIADSAIRADAPDVTAAEAIASALTIESSIMDSHFYEVVASDAPEFQIIAKRLSSDTQKHVETIRNHFST